MTMEFEQVYRKFLDYLAPVLDTYEHVIYAYILRHTILEDVEEAVIPFKSAREKMSKGSGQKGSAMSEATCREKLQSLESKGAIVVVGTEHRGTRVRLVRPEDIPMLEPKLATRKKKLLEDMDFFEVQEHRMLIFEREKGRCFYTLAELNHENFVIDHVVSRPEGNNGYRNLVACSRQANNRKGSMNAADFLFRLYHHDKILDYEQFTDRLNALEKLKAGDLKPQMPST
ncbi:MAG: HNH endonuclease [Gammaproteobacteria bacterium]|nr:HNH endonuclease [Gammaproteobacteria bacterium]MYE30078.1 HNH endonuclease [Gammaproteobacteria bacterium]